MINIDNKFAINADEQQFTLCEKKIAKTGKNQGTERLETIGYYPSIASALNGYFEIKTRQFVSKNDCTVKEAVVEMQRIEKEMKNIVNI